jgi:Ca-activated chloride channel family protein
VEGGVAGGVPGGVVGGVVGGLPSQVIAIGGAGDRAALLAPRAARPDADRYHHAAPRHDTEAYDHIAENPFLEAATNPLSTFSIDVDTASYANVRRFLGSGRRPPADAVRIEELVNYFRYEYAPPEGRRPVAVTTELAACPWAPEHRLLLVGLQSREIERKDLPPRSLVFLLDVSGSMDEPRKLPLLKAAMGLLVDTLRPQDRVAIVVYAGAAGVVLPPTPGDRKETIRRALDQLQAGGSTAGGAGIQLAYRIAAESFPAGGASRVILATDGDFNVGVSSQGELVRLIEEKRKTGVFLSVLGFGEGNLKDAAMEKLADTGNGNYSYLDTLAEARKVLVAEAGATLVTVAKDVKIQLELNPRRVAAYRLLGYENRALRAEDFADDRKDAGEMGAGHSVTALYEIVPAGASDAAVRSAGPLRYQELPRASAAAQSDELATVKLRWKAPEADRSEEASVVVRDVPVERPSPNLRFAAAVAGFGMLLRGSEHRGDADWALVRRLATEGRGADPEGYRGEFLRLVDSAEALAPARPVSTITR